MNIKTKEENLRDILAYLTKEYSYYHSKREELNRELEFSNRKFEEFSELIKLINTLIKEKEYEILKNMDDLK